MKRKGVITILIFLLLTTGVLVWRGSREQKQVFTLPNGDFVKLEAITYGSIHEYSSNPAWKDRLLDHAPKVVGKILSEADFKRAFVSPNNTLALWLSCYDPVAQKKKSLNQWTWCVVDEHGCPLHNGSMSTSMMTGKNKEVMTTLETTVFPRRQREFTIVGRNGDQTTELKIPNPLPMSKDEWVAAALPQTKRAGNTEVTLKGWRYVDTSFPGSKIPSNFSRVIIPELEVRESGKLLSDHFYTSDYFFNDATGNRSKLLCMKEAAWKLELNIWPSIHAPQDASNLLHLASVQLPKEGEFVELEITEPFKIKGLVHAGFTGVGSYAWSNGVFRFEQPMARSKFPMSGYSNKSMLPNWWLRKGEVAMPALWLMATNRQALEGIKLRAKDEMGRVYPDFRSGDEVSSEHNIYFRTALFDLPDNAGRVTFETIITMVTNRFEFMVKPPEKPTNKR